MSKITAVRLLPGKGMRPATVGGEQIETPPSSDGAMVHVGSPVEVLQWGPSHVQINS